jgi:predicted O-methyltransferase YrrM
MKIRLALAALIPGTAIFGLTYVAGTQTLAPPIAVFLASLVIGSVTALIALVALIAIKILRLADRVSRNMATKVRVNQIDKNSRRENRRELANLFHQVEATIQLESIYGFNHPLPPSRSWAVSPDLIVEILNQIRDNQPKLIVELGSGLSTVWIARMLEREGCGKLVSIDHDAKFAQKTSEQLAIHKLGAHVDLRVGALEKQAWGDETQNWYPKSLLDGIEKIDLLLVDGPPKNDSGTYRWPAMWELESRMNSRAVIILDDVIRQEEADLAKAWAEFGKYKLEIKNLEKRAGILSR